MVRYSFRLPEPIGVSDGYTSVHVYNPPEPSSEVAVAHVTIRQVAMESDDATTLSMRSLGRLANLDRLDAHGVDAQELPLVEYPQSVAHVATLSRSPDDPPADWDGQQRSLGPRQDSFMRALHAVQSIVRAAGLSSERKPPILPTYERMPIMILMYEAVVRRKIRVEDLSRLRWKNPTIVLLDHINAPGDRPEPVPDETIGQWTHEIGVGNPGVPVKEHFQLAMRFLHVDGEYGQAVVAASTAVEVLCDSLLSALLWEEHSQSEDVDIESSLAQAALVFGGDATALKRATAYLVPRLGGDWVSPRASWKTYRDEAAQLRNRIVHLGYRPNRQEAALAIQQALDTQTFLFDRLSANRNLYPRTCYVLLGKLGLERRGLYSGKIKRFIEETVPTEPQASASYAEWHRSVIALAGSQ